MHALLLAVGFADWRVADRTGITASGSARRSWTRRSSITPWARRDVKGYENSEFCERMVQLFARGSRVMYLSRRWALPDAEEHLAAIPRVANNRRDGRLRYQGEKYDAAMRYVRHRRVAVDGGAHFGLFSHGMAKDFNELIAFEPVAEHQACWRANMAGVENARLECCALGEHAGNRLHGESAAGVIRRYGHRPDCGAQLTPIRGAGEGRAGADADVSMTYELPVLDFLKLDCEGYEVFIVRGARKTLQRCKPCVMVEQKAGSRACAALRHRIARCGQCAERIWCERPRRGIKGDYILTWGK